MLEVVAECTFAGLVGTVDNLAGRVDLDAFLHEHAWVAMRPEWAASLRSHMSRREIPHRRAVMADSIGDGL